MRILEQEPYPGSERFMQVIERLNDAGDIRAVVTDEEQCDHYWVIDHLGERILFVGTSDSFGRWCAENHAELELDLTAIATHPPLSQSDVDRFAKKVRENVYKMFTGPLQ